MQYKPFSKNYEDIQNYYDLSAYIILILLNIILIAYSILNFRRAEKIKKSQINKDISR